MSTYSHWTPPNHSRLIDSLDRIEHVAATARVSQAIDLPACDLLPEAGISPTQTFKGQDYETHGLPAKPKAKALALLRNFVSIDDISSARLARSLPSLSVPSLHLL